MELGGASRDSTGCGILFFRIVIQSEAKDPEDIHVYVNEILRFALNDKIKFTMPISISTIVPSRYGETLSLDKQ